MIGVTVVERLTRAVEQMPDVRLAVLFGSVANETPGPDSDVDVGLSLRRAAVASPALQVQLERAVGRQIDLVWLDEAPPLLRFEIARQGVVLVDREPHGWSDFRANAMIDWWDWAPTARMMHQVMTARLKLEAARGSS